MQPVTSFFFFEHHSFPQGTVFVLESLLNSFLPFHKTRHCNLERLTSERLLVCWSGSGFHKRRFRKKPHTAQRSCGRRIRNRTDCRLVGLLTISCSCTRTCAGSVLSASRIEPMIRSVLNGTTEIVVVHERFEKSTQPLAEHRRPD